jgi:hypothetical protein
MKLPLPIRLALITLGLVAVIAVELILAIVAALVAVLVVTAWVI